MLNNLMSALIVMGATGFVSRAHILPRHWEFIFWQYKCFLWHVFAWAFLLKKPLRGSETTQARASEYDAVIR
jgi:hypothetical protein